MDSNVIRSKLHIVAGVVIVLVVTVWLIYAFAPRQLDRESSAAYKRGKGYFKKGDYFSASLAFSEVVTNHPEFFPAHYNLGCAYDGSGNVAQAIKSYKRALELNPRYLPALFNLGNVYEVTGNYQEAIDCYRRVLELEPYHRDAFFNLIHDYIRIGQVENARVYLESGRMWFEDVSDLDALDKLEEMVDDKELELMRREDQQE
ncbi:MAG: tetratricopeptide repeat protein [Candidatus Omnitrophica bacterium]|nr:tetratricopeptide repeat protein [Candidatus Omnitrophota bacterium]